ncbi:MAG: hypothetical protein WC389_00060 [Lutibacter sp.]|jgi:hypothetical protein
MKKTAHEFKGGWGKIIIEAPTQKAAKKALQSFKLKILYLTVHKQAFDVMVTGEKTNEFRKYTKWIISRLIDKKTLKPKEYDVVKIVNGYGNSRPYFIAEFKGFFYAELFSVIHYSNGLQVKQEPGDFVIKLGKITERKH